MVPKIKFKYLLTDDDWLGALHKILTAAQAEGTTPETRAELRGLLMTYAEKSPQSVAESREIARQALEDLAVKDIAESIKRIKSRSAKLARLTGKVEGVTGETEKRTAELDGAASRLAKTKEVLDACAPGSAEAAGKG